MKTRPDSTTFHLISRLTKPIFQKAAGKKPTLRPSTTFWRFGSLMVFTALIGGFFFVSSNHMGWRGSSVEAFAENISTFAGDCTTPQTNWNLGGTVCAGATGAPEDRRIAWVAPNGKIAQVSNFFSGSGGDTYQIPTGLDPFAQVGTWAVTTIDSNGVVSSEAKFVVRDPGNASADLQVSSYGPFQTSAGNTISYRVEVVNQGPDAAQSVVLTSSVPGDTTFVSESQNSGPLFTCTTPSTGSSTGTISCSLATLPANTTATFTLTYQVDSPLANGTDISNTVSISSATPELHAPDNSASASSSVVSSTSACTISCPSVAPVSTSQCNAIVNFASPTTSGNCGINPEEEGSGVVCSPSSGSTFPIGNTVVTCIAPTGASCNFTVTVNYTGSSGGLTINCPANLTADGELSGGTAQVSYPSPTTNGTCVTVVCSPPSGSTFPSGTTTVTCTATDPSNASATCSFTVTVNGGSSGGCTIICPEDVTQNASGGQCNAVVSYTAPTTSGTCGAVTCNPASGSTFPVGTTIVSCSSTDGATCDFTVTVNAATPPTITTCATNKTISANSNCEATIPNLIGEVVATGCGVSISQSPTAGTIVGPGPTTVTITAENSAGDVSCTATVTVLNTVPSVITCPADVTKANDANQCGAVVSYPDPTASNACSNVTISCVPPSGAFFPTGLTNVTCTATDAWGNTATCTFKVTVNDTQPPTLTCPSNIAIGTNPNSVVATVNYQSTVSDNCPGATVSCTPPSGSQFPIGATTVTCTATDAAQNQSSCSFTVTVSDTQPPTITCPASIIVSNNPNQCAAVVSYPSPQVTDNQPGATSSCTPASGASFPVGVTAVNCTATDAGGNQSTCSFTVTVKDTQLPAISCPANINVANAPGQCSAIVNPGVATAVDNCPGVTVIGVRSDGLALNAAYPVGTTLITWTARDTAIPANQVSCTQSIVVTDTQAPVITGASADPSTLWPPNHKMKDVTINYSVADNCTASSQINCVLSVTSNEGTSADWQIIDAHRVKLRAERDGGGNGRIYTITITCKDSANNTTTKTVTVTVPHNQ